jgi:hypothetical protein
MTQSLAYKIIRQRKMATTAYQDALDRPGTKKQGHPEEYTVLPMLRYVPFASFELYCIYSYVIHECHLQVRAQMRASSV